MTMILDVNTAERFANLALACVHREYPNKIAHTLNSDSDVLPPRKLTPAFYGCYDWHSSVHGHWMLARLARTFTDAGFTSRALEALKQSLTPENILQETAYLQGEGRGTFERPYGSAWLLQLGAELREWDDSQGRQLAINLHVLENLVVERLSSWLPKLPYPVRSGEHSQSAFAIGLMLDYARTAGLADFSELLITKARQFYLNDRDCPLAYEPSGEDFISPCLSEADVMRRVLPSNDFSLWLRKFMPQVPVIGDSDWLQPALSPDPSDGKLAHLNGLNLSRAWMLNGIAAGLPHGDERLPAINASAEAHRHAGLTAVTGEHYEGGHWLGSFAVYLVTGRGIQRSSSADDRTDEG